MKDTQIGYCLELPSMDEPLDVLINVTYFHHSKGDKGSRDSDWDFHGYYEVEFNLLHEDGTPAPELDKLLTDVDTKHIEVTVFEYMSED